MSTEEIQDATTESGANPAEDFAPREVLWPPVGFMSHVAVIVVLATAVLLTFANTLHNTGFALDNKFIILEDPRLRDDKPENIKQIFQEDYWWPKAVSGLYRPLTTLSYMVNYKTFGNRDDCTGYHFVNAFIHWLNAVLIYLAVLVLMEKLWPALFTALLFAAHPIVTESVTNIVGRADLFATGAVLLGFVVYAKSHVANKERFPSRAAIVGVSLSIAAAIGFTVVHRVHPELLPALFRSTVWVILGIGACAFGTLMICTMVGGLRSAFWLSLLMVVTGLGVFCKESAVVVLGVIGLYDFTYRMEKRHSNWFINLAKNYWNFFWRGYIVLVPVFLALWYVRSWVFAHLRPPELPFVDNPLVGTDFWTARLTAIKVIGRYFWLLLWPRTLSCDYSYNQIPFVTWQFNSWEDIQALLAIAAIVTLLVVAIRNYRQNKPVFFFILFFFGTLLPSSNLIPNPTFGQSLFDKTSWCIGSIMAERFLYLPSIGFAGCAVIAVYATCRQIIPQLDISAWSKRIWLQIVARCVLVLMTIGYGTRAFLRNYDWEDDVRLWTQAARACPDSFKTHKSLAYALYEKDPEFKYIDRIIEEGEKAVKITDRTQIVFLHLGAYYRLKGDLLAQHAADGSLIPSQESIPWYQKSAQTLERAVPLDHEFNDDNRHKELRRGRKPEEIPDIGNHEIYWNLGLSYMRIGNTDAALKAYDYMRHLSPANPDSYLSIASVYITTGKNEDAAIALLQALLLDSNRPEALRSLIGMYQQIDRDGCAMIYAAGRSSPQLNADCPLVHGHICRAYAGLAQVFAEAKQYAVAQQTRNNAITNPNSKCPPEMFNLPAKPATAAQ